MTMKNEFKVGDIIKCLWYTGIYKIVAIKKNTSNAARKPENIFVINKILHEHGKPCKSRVEKTCFEYALKPVNKYIEERQTELNVLKEHITFLK